MNRKLKPSSSNLFLLELILSILIFALASTVCVSFFMQSHKMSTDAYNLNHAVECSDSIAEICRSASSKDQLGTLVETAYNSSVQTIDEEDGYTMYIISYDDSFQLTSQDSAAYLLNLSVHEDSGMIYSSITVINSDATASIYTLDVQHTSGGGQ